MGDDKDAAFKARGGCASLSFLPATDKPECKEAPETAVNKDFLWYWVDDESEGYVEAAKVGQGKYSIRGPSRQTRSSEPTPV